MPSVSFIKLIIQGVIVKKFLGKKSRSENIDFDKLRKDQCRDYIKGTNQILEYCRQEKVIYEITILGKNFVVYPNVFSPKYFNDTEFFAHNIPISYGENVLEVGSGTGVISIFAIYKGARKVIATDINLNAVQNTKENVCRHQLEDKIEVRHGNVFDPIHSNEIFDLIFWNLPFGYIEAENTELIEYAVHDPFYRSIKKFIINAKNYLKKDGRICVGFSSTLGNFELLKQLVYEANMSMREVTALNPTNNNPFRLEIFEIK